MSALPLIERMRCPECLTAALVGHSGGIACQSCGRSFPRHHGILHMYTDDMRDYIDGGIQRVDMDEANTVTDVLYANIEYHNRTAGEYDSDHGTPAQDELSRRRVRDMLMKMAKTTDDGVLLDMGCGTGLALQLARGLFRQSIGLDVSLEMLKRAKGRGHDVMLGNCYRLPFQNDSIGSVVALSVLHHLPDPDNMIREALRVLKPGGIFYIDFEPNRRAYELLGKCIYRRLPIIGQYLDRNKRHPDEDRVLYELTEYQHTKNYGLDPKELISMIPQAYHCDSEISYVDLNGVGESYRISRIMMMFYVMVLRPHLIRRPEYARYFALVIRKPGGDQVTKG